MYGCPHVCICMYAWMSVCLSVCRHTYIHIHALHPYDFLPARPPARTGSYARGALYAVHGQIHALEFLSLLCYQRTYAQCEVWRAQLADHEDMMMAGGPADAPLSCFQRRALGRQFTRVAGPRPFRCCQQGVASAVWRRCEPRAPFCCVMGANQRPQRTRPNQMQSKMGPSRQRGAYAVRRLDGWRSRPAERRDPWTGTTSVPDACCPGTSRCDSSGAVTDCGENTRPARKIRPSPTTSAQCAPLPVAHLGAQ